jgi:hypothetical protein
VRDEGRVSGNECAEGEKGEDRRRGERKAMKEGEGKDQIGERMGEGRGTRTDRK